MLTKTAIAILRHERGKYAGVVCGVALALFLAILQTGFYLGFRRDITVVADSFDADLWVSQRELLAFDQVAHFDDLPCIRVGTDPDVLAVMPVIADWSRVRKRSGDGTEEGQIVGVDLTSGVYVQLGVDAEVDLPNLLTVPGSVLVDEKHLSRLGLAGFGEVGVEIHGLNANVVGVMRGKKLFSTACLIVTDLENARRFLGLLPNRISFIAVKLRPGANALAVQARLQSQMKELHVWTAGEFHNLTQNYWMMLTGIGPVILLSAALAALVGFITVFLTFTHLTAEKLPVYAAMKAMGATTGELAGLVLAQIALVFSAGALLAVAAVIAALAVLTHTTISVSVTSAVWTLGIGFMALCSFAAGLHALRLLAAVEPAEAFRI